MGMHGISFPDAPLTKVQILGGCAASLACCFSIGVMIAQIYGQMFSGRPASWRFCLVVRSFSYLYPFGRRAASYASAFTHCPAEYLGNDSLVRGFDLATFS